MFSLLADVIDGTGSRRLEAAGRIARSAVVVVERRKGKRMVCEICRQPNSGRDPLFCGHCLAGCDRDEISWIRAQTPAQRADLRARFAAWIGMAPTRATGSARN